MYACSYFNYGHYYFITVISPPLGTNQPSTLVQSHCQHTSEEEEEKSNTILYKIGNALKSYFVYWK